MKYKRIITLFIISLSYAFLFSQEKGIASYYSNRMHGRRMSDGTRYHKDSLTCAHRTYPLGSLLRVTNIKNKKSVIVKVTDRCGRHRIIDLSYAAAKEIDLIRSGVAMVKVEKVRHINKVPFKPDDDDEMPEFDFERTEMPDYLLDKVEKPLKTQQDKPTKK